MTVSSSDAGNLNISLYAMLVGLNFTVFTAMYEYKQAYKQLGWETKRNLQLTTLLQKYQSHAM